MFLIADLGGTFAASRAMLLLTSGVPLEYAGKTKELFCEVLRSISKPKGTEAVIRLLRLSSAGRLIWEYLCPKDACMLASSTFKLLEESRWHVWAKNLDFRLPRESESTLIEWYHVYTRFAN